ncbi:hypothetical protein KCP91_01740 [Microvirga sp. SRT01]|jgi:hypothetical protein|uniref:Uncharacterized protein n=1 Tax=Sphingomonas longa TaxID=2778730 RepID=A0ABS2D2D3_9SPHN|nr:MULTISPECIES: hypothetical protein [Alphaproteobacteria]MBM6575079.1 hypothetical protein [Sphingomonas sp. BT552]MBR7708130.1 hypothetical protein [Microvirga sp. SRT01]
MMTPDLNPDPRTAPDDAEDATNQGVSTTDPAEGADADPAEDDGSPQG